MKVLFVDDRPREIIVQWQMSGCESNHKLLPILPFESVEQTMGLVQGFEPEVIIIGHGLSHAEITGSDVIRVARDQGYQGLIIGNSGGGGALFEADGIKVDGNANRNPSDLRRVLGSL